MTLDMSITDDSIRVARAADAAQLRTIYAPHVERNAVSFETEVPSVETMRGRIENLLPTHPWIVSIADERITGYAYASPHRERAAYRWSVEVTAYVHPEFHGQGVGKRLYATLCTLLQRQNYVNAFGIITLPNVASIALHEACGFRPCATYRHAGYKFGAWHDVGWWQLAIQQPAADPLDPVPFAALKI